jgi:hypothetical protein
MYWNVRCLNLWFWQDIKGFDKSVFREVVNVSQLA